MTTVGERIRRLRELRGMTQMELAAALPLSSSYVSLIETDKRKPRRRVLELVAKELGCTTEYLLTGRGGQDTHDIDLDLRFAELSLKSGEAEVARDRFRDVLARAEELGYDDASHEARWGLCRANETVGDLLSALDGLQRLFGEDSLYGTVRRLAIANAMCRTLLKLGDLSRAIEIGETALQRWPAEDQLDIDKAMELRSSLIFCYHERGDLATAEVYAQELVERADQGRSPLSRGSAYWNASIVAVARGDVRRARAYSERALALYSESDNERRTALMRADYARVLVRQQPPEHVQAAELLRRAIDELRTVGSSRDVAGAETDLARCLLVAGDSGAALETVTAALLRLPTTGELDRAEALSVTAYARAAVGDVEAALAAFEEAATCLAAVDGGRRSAAVWRELADLLLSLGRLTEAVVAYQRAADAAGLPTSVLYAAREATAARRSVGRQ